MNHGRLIVLGIFCLSLLRPFYSLATPLNSGSYKIVKVSRLDAADYSVGRAKDNMGYQFNYIDKFYTAQQFGEQRLAGAETGEYYFIQWRCSNISHGGEKIQLQFQYRTVDNPEIKKKNVDVFVDRGGFYETPVERMGDSFLKEGPVESWKVMILREGKVLDHQTSEFWTEV